jgi:hypothetical protein
MCAGGMFCRQKLEGQPPTSVSQETTTTAWLVPDYQPQSRTEPVVVAAAGAGAKSANYCARVRLLEEGGRQRIRVRLLESVRLFSGSRSGI